MALIRRKTVRSWLGSPVPADPRITSGGELMKLISTAEQRGFSRRGKDLCPREQEIFALLPYLYEGSPEASWMCLVVQVGEWLPPAGSRPDVAFGRLDITLADFDSLRRAKRRQRDQLLHWTAWLAAKAGAVLASGAETQRCEPNPKTSGAEAD
jgi:hypothetical protein